MADGQIKRILVTAAIALFSLTERGAPATLIDLAIQPSDVSILGEAASDLLGTALATGDINGDGIEDLLAAACNSHPLGGTRTGTLYVIWGDQFGQPGAMDLALDPPGVSRVFGKPGDDYLACNVTSGDFNRDGYDDIVWGQPLTSDQSNWAGKAYVIFGGPSFPDTLDLYSEPAGVVTIYGDVEHGAVGLAACACDVDGDDYDDIVLAAPWLDYSEIFVIRGRGNFPSTFHTGLSEPGMTRIIDDTIDANMRGLACRDVNGDGSDDLLLGAVQAKRLALLYGSPELIATDSVLIADPPVPLKLVLGEPSHAGMGISVAIADLNADGRQDIVAGVTGADPQGCYDCGEVLVLYDADALPDTVDLVKTTAQMTRVVGFGSSTKYGFRVLGSDLSGDSIDDLVITNDPLNVRATVSVVLGHQYMPATIFLATENGPITRIKEATKGDRLGHGVTALDLDNDGTRDLMLGAHYADPPGRNNAGILYGFFGGTLMTNVGEHRTPSFSLETFPNPFSERTTFAFGNVPRGAIELSIYDVAGRRVFGTAVPNHRGGGLELVWDGRDDRGRELPSGVYFCRAWASGDTETRKIVLVR